MLLRLAYLTMRHLGPLFGVSSSTVCRMIQRLGPLLPLEPVSRPVDAADRLWMADGTLVPVRDLKVGASSRNYPFSANVRVIVDADAWRASGLAEHCHDVTVLGDGAYLNCGMVVPHRKRLRRPLLAGEEAAQRYPPQGACLSGAVISRMKNYKILHDCRQHCDGLHHAVQVVAHMHNLALTS